MDKLLRREVVLIAVCCISIAVLTLQIVQCMTDGAAGGIPEEEAEDENIN